MFKKLVTNLPYSPGLLNQVGFYTKRLKQEEFVRRMGLVFGVLALLLNINITMFAPESSVLASPANDVVSGGIYGSSARAMQDRAIASMNASPYTRAIFNYYGISESDIRSTSVQYIRTGDQSYRSVGKQSFGRGAESCRTHQGYYFCERSMYAAYSYRDLSVKALTGIRGSKVGTSDPWFALLESCGNVVVRTGKDESLSVSKSLSPDQNKNVKAGDTVRFRVKVKANNANGAAFPKINDTLPEHTAYVDHSPKDMFDKADVNGRNVTLRGTKGLYGLGPNQERVIEIKARVLNTAPAGAKLCNKVGATSIGDSAISASEPCVTVKVDPQPMCLGLKMLGAGGINKTRTFEATAKSDGATITEYVFMFGDGQSKSVRTDSTKASVSHTYQPGTYTAKVLVKTSAGDVGNSGVCMANLTVDEQVPDPRVTCDYIRLIGGMGAEKAREFEVSATPQNGAKVNSFKVDFGDGQSADVSNSSNNKNTVNHDYEKEGSYTVRVTANTSLGQVTNNSSCILEVQIEEGPCIYDESLPKDDPNCKEPEEPCEHDETLPKDDPECKEPEPSIIRMKKAENVTQSIEDAHNTTARGGDTIKYTLITENDGTGDQVDYIIREDMGDVLQYSDIVDTDGGELSDDGYVVTWPKVTIKPGEVIEKTMTVKIKSPVPNTPVSASDPLAYDLMMENAYGNNVTIKLPKTPPKQIEEVVTTLPNTGPGANAMISTLFFMVVSYFYFRNRLISKELGLIKNEFSGGVI